MRAYIVMLKDVLMSGVIHFVDDSESRSQTQCSIKLIEQPETDSIHIYVLFWSWLNPNSYSCV